MSMLNDILVPVLIMWPIFLGTGLSCMFVVQKFTKEKLQNLDKAILFGAAYLLGAALVTFFQFFLSLIKIPILISFWGFAPIAATGFFLLFKDIKNTQKQKLLLSRVVTWVLLLAICFFFFTRSFARTMYTWDAVAFWMPKIFALWQDGVVMKETFEFFNHPEYPLLLPMTGATVFSLFSAPNEVAVKVALFGYTLAFLLMLEGFLHKTQNLPKKLFFLFLMLSLFIFREHVAGEYVGTADILVGIYMFAGAALLLQKKPLLALLLWAFVPWTKSEGMVWILSSGFLTVLFFWKSVFKKYWSFLLLPVFFVSVWSIYNKIIGMSSQYFKFDEIYARPWLEYAVYSVHAFREEFRNLQKWNLLFFFFFAATLTRIKEIFSSKELMVLMLSLIAQVSSYILIFTITPEEQATFIAAAISRLTLHIAPTALLVTAYLFKKES